MQIRTKEKMQNATLNLTANVHTGLQRTRLEQSVMADSIATFDFLEEVAGSKPSEDFVARMLEL